MQSRFRAKELRGVREFFKTSLGDEGIVIRDKVIQVVNRKMSGYNWRTRENEDVYVANGDIGGVGHGKNGFLNVAFAGKPNLTFGFRGKDFGEDFSPLELAYALTIHKAQGSQFGTVFVVIPNSSRLLSRELLYTALTRSRERLVLSGRGRECRAFPRTQQAGKIGRRTAEHQPLFRSRSSITRHPASRRAPNSQDPQGPHGAQRMGCGVRDPRFRRNPSQRYGHRRR